MLRWMLGNLLVWAVLFFGVPYAGVRFVPVDTFDQVLPIALEYMPTPTAREDKPAAVPVAKSKRADRPVAQ